MATLSLERINLKASAVDRTDAIRQAGELLVKTGCVLPPYVDGMLAREETMSTYLGNGISIPHGLLDNRVHILQTGISVLQLPDGVEWDEGEIVHLVIGIAASSDEHIGVLSNLAEIVEDDNITRLLMETTDSNLVLGYLSGEQVG
jgi:mannitol PTS system EIIA component